MTVAITITLDLDANPWVDLQSEDPVVGELSRIGLLRSGTAEGRATVGLVVTLPDGTDMLAHTTWRALFVAVHALAASPIGREQDLG